MNSTATPTHALPDALLVPRESEYPDATPPKAPAADANPSAVRTRAPLSELLGTATREGMRTLKQDGIEKVLQGHTTMEQVRTACA